MAEEIPEQTAQVALTGLEPAPKDKMPQKAMEPVAAASAEPLCWICKKNKADSGEHKTKRSDLLAVLGKPSQQAPFFYHDLEKANRPVGSLDAKILKSPVRICSNCNNARTQPHDRAWEAMSDRLRSRRLAVGQWTRCNSIFRYATRREMINVHLFFLKLTGCMIAEAKANGHDVPISLDPFSAAIMTGQPHAEVHLEFGKHDGIVGRSDLHCWTVDPGKSVLAAWLYELDTIAVSVIYAQGGRFEQRRPVWHPRARSNTKRFRIADFMYSKRDERELTEPAAQSSDGKAVGRLRP